MLQVEHLTRRYGPVTAVDDLSFEIAGSGVYGFLGPNGAGKSTTMNIMTGCLSATSGTVVISGYDIYDQPKEAKRRIGYLPEQPPLYLGETPEEYLRFVGAAKGLRGEALTRQIGQVIEETGIGAMRSRRIDALSKGYRQRVGIAQALLADPEIVILDEPTVGLDPLQILDIRALIASLGRTRTVLISSHILSEVQTICEKILIIDKGKLIAFDTPKNLEQLMLAPSEITILAEASAQEVREILGGLSHITRLELEPSSCTVTARIQTDLEDIHVLSRAIFLAFAGRNKALLEMSLKKANLEDIFIQLTENGSSETSSPSPEKAGAPHTHKEVEQ